MQIDLHRMSVRDVINEYKDSDELGALHVPTQRNGKRTMWNGFVINKLPLHKRIVIRHKRSK